MIQKLEKWSGIIALLFGAVALILSWQANNIAQKQLTPNVMLIDVSGSGGGGSVGADAYCWGRVQLANLGGASTSITGFSGKVSFLDDEIELGKYQANWLRSRDESLFGGKLHSFNVTMELANLGQSNPDYSPIDTYPEVSMPIVIKENSPIYLLFIVRYKADGASLTYQSSEFPDLRKYPMQMEYQLYFADGKSLQIPKTDCQWFLP